MYTPYVLLMSYKINSINTDLVSEYDIQLGQLTYGYRLHVQAPGDRVYMYGIL